MKLKKLIKLSELIEKEPTHGLVNNLDLVIVKYGDKVSVLYGRCLHRGAMMSNGSVDGDNLICGLHGWDYRIDTGVSEYNNEEALHKFQEIIKEGWVCVNEDEINEYLKVNPQPDRKSTRLNSSHRT